MKKMAVLSIILVFIFLIFIGYKVSQPSSKNMVIESKILFNLEKIELTTDWHNPDVYNYIDNIYYQSIIDISNKSLSSLLTLVKNNSLNFSQKYILMQALKETMGCHELEMISSNWNKYNEFLEIPLIKNCHYLVNNSLVKPKVTNNIVPIFNKYPNYLEILKESKINVPVQDKMIPQGITKVNDYIFITAYNEYNVNSLCYVLNRYGKVVNVVVLDITSHVGGIAYDEKNQLIWLPDDFGLLNAYDVNDFLVKDKVQAKYQFLNLSNGLENYQNASKNVIDYLCIDDDFLYIGSFSKDSFGVVKKFRITTKKTKIKLKLIGQFTVPAQVQGISFLEHKQDKIMILSTSFGRKKPSFIHLFKYDENISNYEDVAKSLVSYKLPPLLEQVTVANNNLYTLFESSAPKYSNCPDIVNTISIFDLKKIRRDLSLK